MNFSDTLSTPFHSYYSPSVPSFIGFSEDAEIKPPIDFHEIKNHYVNDKLNCLHILFLRVADFCLKLFSINNEYIQSQIQSHDTACAMEKLCNKFIAKITPEDLRNLNLTDWLTSVFLRQPINPAEAMHAYKVCKNLRNRNVLLELEDQLNRHTGNFKANWAALPDSLKTILLKIVCLDSKIEFDPESAEKLLLAHPALLTCIKNDSGKSVLIQLADIYSELAGSGGNKKVETALKDLVEDKKRTFTYDTSVDRLVKEFSETAVMPPLTVALVGVEYAGLLSAGGLAEALEGLAKGILKDNPENKVRLVFPKYNKLPDSVLDQLKPSDQKFLDEEGQQIPVYRAVVGGVECFFIEHEMFTLDEQNPTPYKKREKERFAAFSKLAAEVLYQMKGNDIIHLHDWHAAGVAFKLAKHHPEEWKDRKIPPVVFTFHNNSRSAQGRTSAGIYNYDPALKAFQEAGLVEDNGNLFIETLKIADGVTTVSETFSQESQLPDPEKGHGISFAVKQSAKVGKLTGIINGIYVDKWIHQLDNLKDWKDLETGQTVDLSYGPETPDPFQKKQQAKVQLKKWLDVHLKTGRGRHSKIKEPEDEVVADSEFVFDPFKPVMTFVGRFDSVQKGLDQFDHGIKAALAQGAQVILMGSEDPGDEMAIAILDELEKKYPSGVVFIRDGKDENARYYYQQGNSAQNRPGIGSLVRAATDFVYIPSSYEPCGLVQFEGWLFGSQAIGSKTGGLADTIVTRENDPRQFNGYLFDRKSQHTDDVESIIKKALEEWHASTEEEKNTVIKRIMSESRKRGWNDILPGGLSTVDKYKFVYLQAMQRANARDPSYNTHRLDLSVYINRREVKNAAGSLPVQSPEEIYLDQYYNNLSLSSEELEKLYFKAPEKIRPTLPFPYSRNIDFEKHKTLGAHWKEGNRVAFAVDAPSAKTVKVVFYDDEGYPVRNEALAKASDGYWKTEVASCPAGQKYRYEINGKIKIDPFGRFQVHSDKSAIPFSAIQRETPFNWTDGEWIQNRNKEMDQFGPMNIYEVHPSLWLRDKEGRYENYQTIAHKLVEHCKKGGFTHVQVMGILDHPNDGPFTCYQATGFFSPNSRFGSKDDFKKFVDILHENGISIILDWIPAHFAKDEHSFGQFDGTAQYEVPASDLTFSSRRVLYDWGTYFFDYSKKAAREFLLSSAYFWLDEMHVDGLRVDAVACMLDNEKPESSRLFMRQLNNMVHKKFPGVISIAEDYSGNTKTTSNHSIEGLGFDLKCNIGWKQHTLKYFSRQIEDRPKHYQELVNAIEEDCFHKMILTFSHDEVGDKPLFKKLKCKEPETRYANVRSLLSYMTCCPGKKLNFMGNELGCEIPLENHRGRWDKGFIGKTNLQNPEKQQLFAMVSTLNDLYKTHSAFWKHDDSGHDISWIEKNDPKGRILAYRRHGANGEKLACFHNFAGTDPIEYQVPLSHFDPDHLPMEIFSSDKKEFGGSGIQNDKIQLVYKDGKPDAYKVIVPPLSTIIIQEYDPTEFKVVSKPSKPFSLFAYGVEIAITKIKGIAEGIFQSIQKVVSYPLYYLGSKTWSLPGAVARFFIAASKALFEGQPFRWEDIFEEPKGYHRFFDKVLTREEVKPFLKYGCMAAAVHSNKSSWMAPFGYTMISPEKIEAEMDGTPKNLKTNTSCFYNPVTGLKVGLYEKGNNILVGFGALDSSSTEEPDDERKEEMKNLFLKTGTLNLLGGRPEIFEQANRFVTKLRALPAFKGKNIEICGQSIGGSIASYVALKQKLKAVCMNTLPLGAGLQCSIESEDLAEADEYITHVIVKGDIAADLPKIVGVVDSIASFIGLKTPGNFGQKMYVPSAYGHFLDAHNYFLGSLMVHAGFDKRTKSQEIPEEYIKTLV